VLCRLSERDTFFRPGESKKSNKFWLFVILYG